MDDSDIERIIISVEERYGKSRIEYMSTHKGYRQALLSAYIYGELHSKQRDEKLAEGKRVNISDKQDDKLGLGTKVFARYGHISQQAINAYRYLKKRGKVE